MIVNVKPTEKRSKMAIILQTHYDHVCYFCRELQTVRVGVVEGTDYIEIRHLCERHKSFGLWTDPDTAWGWS